MVKKVGKMNDILEKMNKKDLKLIYKALKSNSKASLIKKIEKKLYDDGMKFETMNLKKEIAFLENLYSKEIEKILFILSRKDLLKKVGGLKIMLSGKTGTGKTSLVNIISKKIMGYKFTKISAESLLSPKMGQTQINILSLSQLLKNNSKQIIFIDEIDSIISNRYNDREIMESHRITSSFLQFIDSFSEEQIVIFATNHKDKIDPAIQRRMNLSIEGIHFDISTMINEIKNESNFELTPQQKTILNKLFKNSDFNVAELDWFLNEFEIIKEMEKIDKDYLLFIKQFSNKAEFSNIEVSERMIIDFKKIGIKW